MCHTLCSLTELEAVTPYSVGRVKLAMFLNLNSTITWCFVDRDSWYTNWSTPTWYTFLSLFIRSQYLDIVSSFTRPSSGGYAQMLFDVITCVGCVLTLRRLRFPHYLINGTILEIISQTLLILRRTERDSIKTITWSSCTVNVIRVRF
jgi:hypothetical protein